MKLNKLWLLAAAAGFVACAEPENGLNVSFDGERTVEFKISLPEIETRAANESSAKGGLTNIDWTKYDLRYQIEIYDANTQNLARPRIVEYCNNGGNFEKSIDLTAGRTYKVYAWADFVDQIDGERVEGENYDKHYNTASFASINYMEGKIAINDESCDAYCGSATIDDEHRSVNFTLKRPLGKLRVVTTDADKLSFEQYPDNVVFSTGSVAMTKAYNLLTGSVDGNKTTFSEAAAAPMVLYGDETANGAKRTLLTAYLFAGDVIKFDLTVKDDTADIYTMNVVTDIPVVTDKLTTIMGAGLTNPASITCDVSDTITGGEAVYVQDTTSNWVEAEKDSEGNWVPKQTNP